MQGIHRWLVPEGAEDISIVIPENVILSEAVEITETGIVMQKIVRPDDGSAVIFPEVQVWDDPAKSPRLMRPENGWQSEDTSELLETWEMTRLTQFREHLFSKYHTMQVVYRIPPFAEETHFHRDGMQYQGWRIEMVAAIFAGFKPEGLTPLKAKSKIITDIGRGPRKLRLV